MIKQAVKGDSKEVAQLALLLWPDHSLDEFIREFEMVNEQPDTVVFLAFHDEQAIGFAHCQLRNDYVEGTTSSPVGYLEGIYVIEKERKKGIAKGLIRHCEEWAKQKGCTEFASDCEFDNQESLEMHLELGFDEANRIICFKKVL